MFMIKDFGVTPWEVTGKVDYDKLIKQFGIKPMPKLPEKFQKNLLFRRKIIFAQRDFNRILDSIRDGRPFVVMTGLMPSGKFHLGHKILIDQIIFYQRLGAKIYLAVADIEAYNTRNKSMRELEETAIREYLENYIALGLKPEKCDFYFQSKRSDDWKKSNAYYKLAGMLASCATFNEFRAVYGEITPGKMVSSLFQASDMLHAQLDEFEGKVPVLVPVGIDQDPHLRIARDMSRRIKEFDFMQLSSTYHKFLPGLKGEKMSSSVEESAIFISDSPKEVKKKIWNSFTGGGGSLKEQKEKGGNPDVCRVYQYLFYLFDDDNELKVRYEKCKKGEILCGECKEYLTEKINKFLKEHRKKKEIARNKIDRYL